MNNVNVDLLKHKYIVEKKAMHIVAREMGIAVGTVYNYIHKTGIKARGRYEYPTTEKQREAWRKIGKEGKGKKLSCETRKKISEAHRNGGIGHKKIRADGYISIYFPDHPKASKDGYIMEHILVMEALIGRHLHENECVHHIDKNRQNNTKENLKLMTKSEHMSFHAKERHEKRRNDLSTQLH